MFTRNEKFEHRRRVWMAIWIVGMLMLGMVPFLPAVSATTSGNITADAYWCNDGSAYISGRDVYVYDRIAVMRFDISSIGAGATISDIALHVNNGYVTASGAMNVWACGALTGSTVTGHAFSDAEIDTWSPSGSVTFTIPINGATGWFSGNGMSSTWQTQYNNDGHISLSLNGWSFDFTGSSYQPDMATAYVVVTYTGGGGGGGVTWKPSITSTPGLTYVSAVPYSYHATSNVSVGWNSTYGQYPYKVLAPLSAGAGWKSIYGNSSLTALVESQRTSLGYATLALRKIWNPAGEETVALDSREGTYGTYLKVYYSGGWSSNIAASADADISPANPSSNYGTSVALYGGFGDWLSLVKYNLSGISATITNTELAVYRSNYYTAITNMSISEPVNTSWTEGGVTWYNYLGITNLTGYTFSPSTGGTASNNCYFNATITGAGGTIPVTVIAKLGPYSSYARATWQNFTLSSGIHFTSTPTTTAEENAAYSYHVTASDGTITLNSTNASWLTYSAGNSTLWGHAPSAPETPYVKLKVDNGSAISWQNFTITVRDTINPTANAGADQANIGEWMQFDGSGSTDSVAVTNYTWTASGMVTGYGVTYNYAWEHSTGVKTVTLTVKDAAGRSGTDTMTVTVSSSSPKIIRPYSDWGTSTWTPVPLTPTTKWDKLREPDAGSDLDATYLTSVTGSTQSYYSIPDLYTSSGSIIENVTVWAWAKKTNASTNPTFVLGTRTNATSSIWLTSTTLTTTWTNYSATLALCPFTGNPWRTYDVSLLRLWIRSSTAAGQYILVSQVAALIHDYDPSPVFTSSPTTAVKLNTAYSYTVTTDISSTKTLDYSDASWLTYSAGNSTLWGRSPSSVHAAYTVNLKAVSTVYGTITYQNYTLSLITWGPTFTSSPPLTGIVHQQYDYVVTVNESWSTNTLLWTAPAWMTLGAHISGTIPAPGTYTMAIYAQSVAGGLKTWQNWSFTVSYLSWSPTFTSSPILTGHVGVPYAYTATFNHSCTWFINDVPKPAWVTTSNSGTGSSVLIQGTPAAIGNYVLHIRIDVTGTHYVWQNFTIVVSLPWGPTYTSTPALTAYDGANYTYHVTLNETVVWLSFSLSGPTLPISSDDWGATSNGRYRSIVFNGSGSYLLSFKFYSVAGTLSAWQNWTVVVTSPPAFAFTNVWIIGHDTSTFAQGLSANWPATTFTLSVSPGSFASLGGSTITFTSPPEGHYTVTVQAHSNSYGSGWANYTYALTITPAAYISPIVSPLWEIVIPFIILMVIGILSAFSRDGVSGTSFMGSLTIGIFILAWAGALGVMTFAAIGFGAFFMAIMLFRAYREGL